LAKPRMLHCTHWGMVCPAETPEGTYIYIYVLIINLYKALIYICIYIYTYVFTCMCRSLYIYFVYVLHPLGHGLSGCNSGGYIYMNIYMNIDWLPICICIYVYLYIFTYACGDVLFTYNPFFLHPKGHAVGLVKNLSLMSKMNITIFKLFYDYMYVHTNYMIYIHIIRSRCRTGKKFIFNVKSKCRMSHRPYHRGIYVHI
jgi:hypothetical protein